MDEQNHIVRGLAFWKTGDPRLSMEHPPLINALSALPAVTIDDITLPTERPSWNREPIALFWYIFAEETFWEFNRELVPKIVFVARLPIVFLTMGMSLISYRFAKMLWRSETSAVLALVLILFDPNIMAHGRYSTTDVGGATFLLLAITTMWLLWSRPSRQRWHTPLLALVMGLAFASKLSNLGFIPVLALLALLPFSAHDQWRDKLGRLRQFFLAGLLSIGVVWAIFQFEWGNFLFLDDRLSWLNPYSGPMPTFWAGIERIAFATGVGRQSFMLGRFSDNGFPLYFPTAYALKTPLVTLLLLVSALVLVFVKQAKPQRPRPSTRFLFLLLPILAYFLLLTQSGLNIGYRHLMPILPLIAIVISSIGKHARTSTLIKIGVSGLALGLVLTNLFAYPHYISFFNRLVPQDAVLLNDSNIDWGQDLLRLNRWMADNQVEQVNLSYFGSAWPDLYVHYTPLPGEPRHRELWWDVPFDRDNPAAGVYVISAHSLQEMPLIPAEKTVYDFFRQRTPDETIGRSLLIYIID